MLGGYNIHPDRTDADTHIAHHQSRIRASNEHPLGKLTADDDDNNWGIILLTIRNVGHGSHDAAEEVQAVVQNDENLISKASRTRFCFRNLILREADSLYSFTSSTTKISSLKLLES